MRVGALVDEIEGGVDPTKYTFMMMLQCTSEEEVALAMERLMMPVVGLCLAGVNVTLMRMPEDT